MIKKLAQYGFILLLVGYLVAAYIVTKKRAALEPCNGIVVRVLDSDKRLFVSQASIESRVKKQYDLNGGFSLAGVDAEEIEQLVLKDQLIAHASCYTTCKNYIYIDVKQRNPVLRIMDNGSGYYIDDKGAYMPISSQYAIPLLVASGNFSREYAQESLYPIAMAICSNPFWSAQIEQIAVLANKEIVLVPRVGNHQILFGTADRYEQKLEKLKLLYDKVLVKKGWNTYSTINLKFKNQVVCTRH